MLFIAIKIAVNWIICFQVSILLIYLLPLIYPIPLIHPTLELVFYAEAEEEYSNDWIALD